ncbi:MAG: alpha/beta fold hydrolase [Acidimicrobiales bacterium]
MSLLRVHHEGRGPTLLWLHGFTQTHRSAWRFRSILADQVHLITLDLPGHGDSSDLDGDLESVADAVASALDAPAAVGGYSFGGRVALHLVLRRPDLVTRLVVLGATRGIADPIAREERRRDDDARARRIEAIGTEKFLDEWLSQPLLATMPADPRERAARSADPRGLARSLRQCGTGTQEWLGERLAEVTVPVLALAGALDLKFATEARAIASVAPQGRAEVVAGAGHAAHLEQPEQAADLVARFLTTGRGAAQ